MRSSSVRFAFLFVLVALFVVGAASIAHAAPQLPLGAKAPPGHDPSDCAGCHAISSSYAPPIYANWAAPAGHAGTYCVGCHMISLSPLAPPLPTGATAPSGHSAGACADCHRSTGSPMNGISSTAPAPAGHWGNFCRGCHQLVSGTAPPLPSGATAPGGHPAGTCANCHTLTGKAAPAIMSDARAPANHYGGFCRGCHRIAGGDSPRLPLNSRAPSSHFGAGCSRCHSMRTSLAPVLESGEDRDEDEDHGDYCLGCHRIGTQGLTFTQSARPTSVVPGTTIAMAATFRFNSSVLANRNVQVWRRRYPSLTWERDASLAYDAVGKTYKGTRRIWMSTQYELRFAGDSVYGPSRSNRVLTTYIPSNATEAARVRAWIANVNPPPSDD